MYKFAVLISSTISPSLDFSLAILNFFMDRMENES